MFICPRFQDCSRSPPRHACHSTIALRLLLPRPRRRRGFGSFAVLCDLVADEPQAAVLYVYELQLAQEARRCGLGRYIMEALHQIGQRAGMDKAVLTVFHRNDGAVKFYRDALSYTVDPTSPSCFGEKAPYEILSFPLGRTEPAGLSDGSSGSSSPCTTLAASSNAC